MSVECRSSTDSPALDFFMACAALKGAVQGSAIRSSVVGTQVGHSVAGAHASGIYGRLRSRAAALRHDLEALRRPRYGNARPLTDAARAHVVARDSASHHHDTRRFFTATTGRHGLDGIVGLPASGNALG